MTFDVIAQHRSIHSPTVWNLCGIMTWHNLAYHRTRPNTFGLDTIADIVAHAFGVRTSDIYGRSRAEENAIPRMVTMLLAHERGVKGVVIARHFGRDHATVINAIKRIRSLSATNKAMRLRVETIRQQIGARYADHQTPETR